MDLVGTWYNELGSHITITSAEDGQLIGEYYDAVGPAKGLYTMYGRHANNGETLGWVVNWNHSEGNWHSTSAWSGQYKQAKREIVSTWLLVYPPDNPISTQVGFDTFTPGPPSAEVKEKALRSGRFSHPMK